MSAREVVSIVAWCAGDVFGHLGACNIGGGSVHRARQLILGHPVNTE